MRCYCNAFSYNLHDDGGGSPEIMVPPFESKDTCKGQNYHLQGTSSIPLVQVLVAGLYYMPLYVSVFTLIPHSWVDFVNVASPGR